ncbi:protein translocase subunit SecD [Pseudactinotalea sp. Z1739]|uniref:protein translocase subunit SecD n=1 Tax=Pseudactinotalea sp. Z1739 TaxID=3413028 RepID=UPI003C7C298B
MAKPTPSAVRPVRTLVMFFIVFGMLFGTLTAGTVLSDATWRPNLALDLEGGTQIILTPRTDDAAEITEEQVGQAIEIIRQRVDSSGVAEAEISSQGGSNIVVGLPGEPTEETLNLVRQSAQMRFRSFLAETGPGPIDPDMLTQAPEDLDLADLDPEDLDLGDLDPEDLDLEDLTGSDGVEEEQGTEDTGADGATGGVVASTTEDQGSEDESVGEGAEEEAAPTPPTREEIEEAAFAAADLDGDGELSDTPESTPTDASDQAWVTEQILFDYYTLDCTDPENLVGGGGDDPDAALVACSVDGTSKFILGPMEIPGTDIESASSGFRVTEGGVVTNEYAVSMQFNSEGAATFLEVTQRISQPQYVQSGTHRFAMVLDGLVLMAPTVQNPIPGGSAEISGNLTRESAQRLASQLNFGALPIEFEVQSEEQISATLGSEQLQRGLLAGLIGLGLVVVYALIQYRALAIISLASLVLGGSLTYLVVALMSWQMGYRLSLAGVAGLIVAIGIIADSFIVYFERIRDEVREGRRLEDAVDQGWKRARRTIVASDAVNLMGAVVLYFVAVGGVRGFAVMLGLITLIDLLVFIFFTHPFMKVLVRTRFFQEGSKISGLDPEHLGAVVSAYRGRGQIRSRAEREAIKDNAAAGQGTIAERRRAEALAAVSARASASADEPIGAEPEDPDSATTSEGEDR